MIVHILKDLKTTNGTVYNVIKRYKETGSTGDRPRRGRPQTKRL